MQKEQSLIKQIAAGDEDALKTLYDLYYPRLVRFLVRVTNNREQIVEIVNDVFFVVWQSAAKFRGQSTVSTWILGIAYKKGLKAVSRQRKTEPLDTAEHLAEGVESHILGQRNMVQLLAGLPPEQKAVIELTYYFGYSYKEIGEILQCPENTVKTRMFHARQKLRLLLEENPHA